MGRRECPFAAHGGHLRIVKKLLVAGANVGAHRTDGMRAYDFAARNGHDRVAAAILRSAEGRGS